MFDNEIFGKALIRLRGHRSQRSVARTANIPTGTLCQWEKGKRRPQQSQISKLLKGLGCTEEELRFTVWQIQGERFKMKGSDLEPDALEVLAAHTESVTAFINADFEGVPFYLRPILTRLQTSVQKTEEKLNAVCTDLEALVMALDREKR